MNNFKHDRLIDIFYVLPELCVLFEAETFEILKIILFLTKILLSGKCFDREMVSAKLKAEDVLG